MTIWRQPNTINVPKWRKSSGTGRSVVTALKVIKRNQRSLGILLSLFEAEA